MIFLQACMALLVTLSANPLFAETNNPSATWSFDKLVGPYKIFDCELTSNHRRQPKDYNCKMLAVEVVKVGEKNFILRFIDENGQLVDLPNLTEFDNLKARPPEKASFTYTFKSARWEKMTFTPETGADYISDAWEFLLSPEGKLILVHDVMAVMKSKYKLLKWTYRIEK